MSTPAPVATRRSASGHIDRRTIIISAVVLIVSILAGVALVAIAYDPGPSSPTGTGQGLDSAPGIVPKPNEGQAPDSNGDRGGWEQIALLAVIVSAMAGIAFVIVRGGGAKARAGRAEWRGAATAGHDGAVDP